jgi:ADP-ribosylglycohydrolase
MGKDGFRIHNSSMHKMNSMSDDKMITQAKAALWGVATGDAFGKMTEGYWPPEVLTRYKAPVTGFIRPIQTGSKYKWDCGETTDDTAFTILVAQSLVTRGKIEETDVIERIIEKPIKGWPGWEDFKHETINLGRMHRVGNGAPMRVSPIGIANPSDQIDRLVEEVYLCCRCTHDSKSAISAACAVAASFSAILDNKDKETVLRTALQAAKLGESLGQEDYLPSVPRRLEWLQNVYLRTRSKKKQGLNPGFPAWEGATFALYLFLKHDSAREAIVEATNCGGDADSIASMSGGLLAAEHPESLPQDWQGTVQERNNLDLDTLAEALIRLREKRASNKPMQPMR